MNQHREHPEVKEFLSRLRPVMYSNQRFDEQQQLARILSELEGFSPGYTASAWNEAIHLISAHTK